MKTRVGARTWSLSLAGVVLATLAACGGGGGGGGGGSPGGGGGNTPTPPVVSGPETVFVPKNAWQVAVPDDAEIVSPEEFRRRINAGESEIITFPSPGDTARENRRVVDAYAYLVSKPDLSLEDQALLQRMNAGEDIHGPASVDIPGVGTVGLLDLGTRILNAADSYARSHDPANALAAYRISFDLLPASVKSQLAAPDTLKSATLQEIRDATTQLNDALRDLPDIDNVRLDWGASAAGASTSIAHKGTGPGNGIDKTGVCTRRGLASYYWFPLRDFVSPVKNQQKRGTCWAFTAIAAVESRERVQNDAALDLSEQFLVNKYKREWFESDHVDGGSSAKALNEAAARNQPLLNENGWTYNPATGRPDNAFDAGIAGTDASYTGTCTGYNGWCSPTAHQSNQTCTTYLLVRYCSYDKYTFKGPGISASRVISLRASGQPFHREQVRALLGSGVSIMAGFPVYAGFEEAANGVVSDFSRSIRDKSGNLVPGDRGGHAVQIIGFLSNEQMSFAGSQPHVDGGGYFIIRNSWGCGAGDGGYYYVPADYVGDIFTTLDILDFDSRRSKHWNDEQLAPGGSSGLTVDPQGTITAGLRVPLDLTGKFTVSHPVASYVRLTVTSNRDGKLYDGQWMVNQPAGGSLFANSLPVNFQSEGTRTLTLTAHYGLQTVTATKSVVVLNSSPIVSLLGNGTPAQGEEFVVEALVADENEADLGPLCNAMEWSVTAPDQFVFGAAGCQRIIRFGASGPREVRVKTHDREGLVGEAVRIFEVAPPPANPYPRITQFGLYSRDPQLVNGQLVGCKDNAVAGNATVDVRKKGCTVGLGAAPWRYLGQVTVENPANESLTYDWTYTVYNGVGGPIGYTRLKQTVDPMVDLEPVVYGGLDVALPCTLDVRVNAPNPARTKTLRVWSGRCINIEDTPK